MDDSGGDDALVERARAGDIFAYESLVRRYQDLAVRTAYVITGGADAAEDVAQEAFVKAYYALARFHAGAPFRPWLLRIVANEARNRRKADGRRAALTLRASEKGPDRAGDALSPDPEKAALDAERRGVLLRALEGLREEDRLVIAYRYLFDLDEAETADALACPRGTVKSRLSRALGRLRDGLAGYPNDFGDGPRGSSGKGAAHG